MKKRLSLVVGVLIILPFSGRPAMPASSGQSKELASLVRCAEPAVKLPLEGRLDYVRLPSLSKEGRFVSAWYGETQSLFHLVVWDLGTQEIVARYSASSIGGGFTPRGTYLLVDYPDRVELYEPSKWSQPWRVYRNEKFQENVHWNVWNISPDEQFVVLTEAVYPAAGGLVPDRSRLLIVELEGWVEVARLDQDPNNAALAPGAEYLVLVLPRPWSGWRAPTRDLTVLDIVNPTTGKRLRRLEVRKRTTGFLTDTTAGVIAVSPDGRLVVSSHSDGTLRFWDPHSGKEVRRLAAPFVMTGARPDFSPRGDILAMLLGMPEESVAYYTGDIEEPYPLLATLRLLRLWSLQEERFLCEQAGVFEEAAGLAVSGNGEFLVVKEAFVRKDSEGPITLTDTDLTFEWFFSIYRISDLTAAKGAQR